ncbi:MAG: bifunctional 5,10-methylenetetrahydrofolate dehydrogenase/5,10-methenyltetrahydrofolate cyclohydrolase [Pyramidobacter sp.]|nr:bifunctional 5,10-methylenetetrahydrofolate dehydrogenase/5,10-methenyltetrahydrofolate cyclohydrolase [Pyramidobacter sp.]
MPQILDGKAVAAALTEDLKKQTATLVSRGVVPTLAIVRVGERGDDLAYERGAIKRAQTAGVAVKQFILPADCTQPQLLETIDAINHDPGIHGCLIFMPLPKSIDERAVRERLSPDKDVDGITFASQAAVYAGRDEGFPPCTPAACMEILKFYGVDPKGKNAVVLGRSLVIGRPAAMMLLGASATITVCHTKTRDAASIARCADILVAAVGHAGAVTPEFVTPSQVVLDVGINVNDAGKLCGDVLPEAAKLAGAYTPVPGGVGSVTTTVLMKHVVEAAKKQSGISN